VTQHRPTVLAVLSVEYVFVKIIQNFNVKVLDNFANKKNLRMDLPDNSILFDELIMPIIIHEGES
jgi:hypothetical protein